MVLPEKPWQEASSCEYASVSTITPERYLFFERRLIKKQPIRLGATKCDGLEKNSFWSGLFVCFMMNKLYLSKYFGVDLRIMQHKC